MIIEGSIPHELKGDADISYKMTGVEDRKRRTKEDKEVSES